MIDSTVYVTFTFCVCCVPFCLVLVGNIEECDNVKVPLYWNGQLVWTPALGLYL